MGAGIIIVAAMPPIRKKPPTTEDGIADARGPSKLARNAPTKVPSACARNGKTKCLASKRWIDAFRPSIVVTSAPAGGGMIFPLIMMSPMLTALPSTRPTTTPRTTRRKVFMR